jgi:tRNA(adenine34) deaminase
MSAPRQRGSQQRQKRTEVRHPDHERLMRRALEEARRARDLGEVPIGAVLARGGEILASGFNRPIRSVDPSAHAEIVAIRDAASRAANYRLGGTTLYVTVEPCLMCVGAVVNARVDTVIYGADEPKWGAIRSLLDVSQLRLNHRFAVVRGVLEDECRKLIQDFFKLKRQEVETT